jgi:uncharacterized protein YkwD
MRKVLFTVSVLTLFISCEENLETEDNAIDVQGETLTIQEEILTLVNEHRQSLGLRTLLAEMNCEELATEHSENMAAGRVLFGHEGFDDRAAILFDLTGASSAAENVAYGQADASQVMESWLNSSGHRENIEGDFTHIGIGIALSANDEPYYTQIFLKID